MHQNDIAVIVTMVRTEPDNLIPIVPFLAVLAFDVYIFKSQERGGARFPKNLGKCLGSSVAGRVEKLVVESEYLNNQYSLFLSLKSYRAVYPKAPIILVR